MDKTSSKKRCIMLFILAVCTALALTSCGVVPTEAVPADAIISCPTLSTTFTYLNTTITTSLVPAGTTAAAGTSGSTSQPIVLAEYCKVSGTMNQRTSPVDGKTYAIGFEMRLPTHWNGRFFHQVNGGTDGSIVAANGDISGGGQASSGLSKGFVVLSSNAGHATEAGTIGGGVFGIDPEARLNYGYKAVAELTPMAKMMIKAYYGKKPDKSYMVGSSNGGRHTMVTASRDYADEYDGFMASSPGFSLPKAAVAQLWGVQQYATISTMGSNGRPDITSSFSVADQLLVSNTILAKCDALDGVADNMVNDVEKCQTTFNINTDIPTCAGAPDGTCLTSGQKTILAAVHAGAKNTAGGSLYTNFLWDVGISSSGWRTWKFSNSTGPRDPLSVAFIFMTPPVSPGILTGAGTTLLDFALNYPGAAVGFNVDTDAPKIFAKDSTYTESAWSFMTPKDRTMSKMVNNRGKMIIVQGAADPVFSLQDTINWYKNEFCASHKTCRNTARLFIVPGMGHSRGGPATDQYDMVDAIVKWVEKGIAPDSIIAKARGAGIGLPTGSVNTEVPVSWNQGRTRPLCPYPLVARWNGGADLEVASSFSCLP